MIETLLLNSDDDFAAAQNALQQSDWAEVVRLAAAPPLSSATPADRALLLAPALTALGRFDEAEAVLTAALKAGATPEILRLHALAASSRSDWASARDRWRTLLDKDPKSEEAAVALATALYRLGAFDQADRVIRSARKLYPQSISVASTWAWSGQARAYAEDAWQAAADRWRDYKKHHFPRPDESINIGIALERVASQDEAESHYAQEIRRFPGDVRFWLKWAEMPALRDDLLAAALRWRATVLRFPDCGAAYAGEARTLADGGFEAEADMLLDRAAAKLPNDIDVQVERAILASRRGDLTASIGYWRGAVAAAPDRTDLTAGLARALEQHALLATSNPEFELPSDKLMLLFESLGDNCELGLVQRLYGAEPVGLFRFTTLQPEHVIPALTSRLQGVGTKDQMTMKALDGEYVLGDTQYNMWSHTFIEAAPDLYESTFNKMTRRIAFLKRNLIYDLEHQKKIFVYKSSREELDISFIEGLFAAVNGFAINTLLVVRKESEQKANGTVEELAPGLLLGYIDELSPPDNATIFQGASWLTVCQRAYVLWKRRQSLDALRYSPITGVNS